MSSRFLRQLGNVRFYSSERPKLVSTEWESKVKPALNAVNKEVLAAIGDLRRLQSGSLSNDLTPNIDLWDEAFQVVEAIADSPKKHLFRPQLTILGYAGSTNSLDDLGETCPSSVVKFAAGVELQVRLIVRLVGIMGCSLSICSC